MPLLATRSAAARCVTAAYTSITLTLNRVWPGRGSPCRTAGRMEEQSTAAFSDTRIGAEHSVRSRTTFFTPSTLNPRQLARQPAPQRRRRRKRASSRGALSPAPFLCQRLSRRGGVPASPERQQRQPSRPSGTTCVVKPVCASCRHPSPSIKQVDTAPSRDTGLCCRAASRPHAAREAWPSCLFRPPSKSVSRQLRAALWARGARQLG
eukprot:16610-Chlamydomonas_euryale.AAC.16